MDLDIEILDENKQLSVQFEIKNKLGTSSMWAGKFLRNLLAHINIQKSPFFILILPDQVYFWKNFQSKSEVVEPDYQINANQLFETYYEKEKVSPENISEERLESIVLAWLSDIRSRKIDLDKLRESQKWLFDSGLIEVIQKGKFHYTLTLEEKIGLGHFL